jgi:hypothetical protein
MSVEGGFKHSFQLRGYFIPSKKEQVEIATNLETFCDAEDLPSWFALIFSLYSEFCWQSRADEVVSLYASHFMVDLCLFVL